ncbi:MAG TPA: UdgX family uracil-DNA binding protein [Vicinamibacterales bacterium]|jgi:DNA polymerase|nr:UdgX family uracil-DNA binding protein [Vicinamibacterales bacterium]
MAERRHPAEQLPSGATLEDAREKAARCHACELWRHATQTVFGAGAAHAEIVLVGEQPGDQEDRAGKPFVGPAGRVLEEALAAAGVDAARVYVTNAVKHFKWVPRGKRRLHAKPRLSEIQACEPWLALELSRIRPRVVVCLGTTAARAVLGRPVTISRHRGTVLPGDLGAAVFVTAHPSSILRAPDAASRARGREQLVADLRVAATEVRRQPPPRPESKR